MPPPFVLAAVGRPYAVGSGFVLALAAIAVTVLPVTHLRLRTCVAGACWSAAAAIAVWLVPLQWSLWPALGTGLVGAAVTFRLVQTKFPSRKKARSSRPSSTMEGFHDYRTAQNLGGLRASVPKPRPLPTAPLRRDDIRFVPDYEVVDNTLTLTLSWKPSVMISDLRCCVTDPWGIAWLSKQEFVGGSPTRVSFPDDFDGGGPVLGGDYDISWSGRPESSPLGPATARDDVLAIHRVTP